MTDQLDETAAPVDPQRGASRPADPQFGDPQRLRESGRRMIRIVGGGDVLGVIVLLVLAALLPAQRTILIAGAVALAIFAFVSLRYLRAHVARLVADAERRQLEGGTTP